ncbi:bifunctional glutamate N-acetyltransferase/amino-acid acetyltransferase ArgJ [uncultured Cardiobacterium sp.]|uniref:bifunctional glutamate N-acetyltransferase/amino-acid acetyltransferase ArgJ n=1 Tax=uncultured Cardiobacterium sp. TaxID=417619 RepID=UPI00260338B2|nr:bifunctional glutamate N-acetyltransferase/amino-acid acetyltransferase ArgJ [uncultured Cardiobacterium sp.]
MFSSDDNMQAGVVFPQGFRAAGVSAGIKKSGKKDVALIVSDRPAAVAAVFTQNRMAAAPVVVAREAVADGRARVVIVNSGVANACTGAAGVNDARDTAAYAAARLGCRPDEVVVASTGVIGKRLPMDILRAGIDAAAAALSATDGSTAAEAIMTTDTCMKAGTAETGLGGKSVRFGIIAKGSGMIQPDMATMLCFITTDAAIAPALLQEALRDVTGTTFNMISVDGDMSTNDMVAVLANGAAGNAEIREKNADYHRLRDTLHTLCAEMARRIAADGEGATKFLTIKVGGARDFAAAKQVAMSVAKSPLVKTAFFGEDPNWGRVAAAVGYAGVPLDPERVSIAFGGITVYRGGVSTGSDEGALRRIMQEREITLTIDLGDGDAAATVWTCDLSYDYVKINGEYRT